MRSFKLLFPFIKKNRWKYIFGILFLLIVDSMQLIIPHILGILTDLIKNHTVSKILLFKYSTIIVIIAIFVLLFRYLWRINIVGLSRDLESQLRDRLFKKLLTLSKQYFDEHKTGDLMAHATNDINAVRMAIGQGVVMAVDSLFMGLSTIFLMVFTIDFRLSLIALLPLPILAIVVSLFGKVIHLRFLKVQDAFSQLTDKVEESLSGIRVIKAFVQEKDEIKNFKDVNSYNLKTNMHMIKIWGLFDPLVQFLSSLSFIIVLMYGGFQVINKSISLGDFVAFTSYLGMLIWPMMATGWVINIFERGSASMDRLNIIYNEKPIINDKNADYSIKDIYGNIEIKNLTFSYKNNLKPVLENININVERGKIIAIIGKTGSGKSTIVNLIERLYKVPDGTIFIDGHDINKIPLKVLRENIGFVPQDNFLFSDKISGNIAFSKDEPIDKIIEYTKMADVHEDIKNFPKAYDTVIGERGVTLSGGQKQRISIARALIKNPKIVIFDDSLSAVDTNTEEIIQENLRNYLKDKTAIIIAHRISTIKNADEIIVLDNGNIKERGTHDELVSLNGLYKDIYEKQLLESSIMDES